MTNTTNTAVQAAPVVAASELSDERETVDCDYKHGLKFARAVLAAATPAARPTDDHLWDETLRDRDTYHDWADKLAEAIAKHFGAYIGEHSNTNCPWAEALEVIEGAAPAVQQPAEGGWISVKDERPMRGVPVWYAVLFTYLNASPNYSVGRGYYDGDWRDISNHAIQAPTHWMPADAPQPPPLPAAPTQAKG